MVLTASPPDVSPHRVPHLTRPSRWRYAWAAIVVLVGLISSVQWGFAVLRASEAEADNFPRADVPGALTVELHPGTWYVYEEAGAEVQDVEVVGPDGAVKVDDVSNGIVDFTGYDRAGGTGNAVGVFRLEPGSMGEYTVTAIGNDEFGDGTFAVGEGDVVTFRRNQTVGLVVMLVVTLGTGVAIAGGTFRRRRAAR